MSQVKLSRVGRSAVSSPPTLWQCQTSRPLPILLVLLLIREPASQESGKRGRKGVGHRGLLLEKHKEIVTQSKAWRNNSCCSSALTSDNRSTKIYYLWPVTHFSCWDNDAVKINRPSILQSLYNTALLDKLLDYFWVRVLGVSGARFWSSAYTFISLT